MYAYTYMYVYMHTYTHIAPGTKIKNKNKITNSPPATVSRLPTFLTFFGLVSEAISSASPSSLERPRFLDMMQRLDLRQVMRASSMYVVRARVDDDLYMYLTHMYDTYPA